MGAFYDICSPTAREPVSRQTARKSLFLLSLFLSPWLESKEALGHSKKSKRPLVVLLVSKKKVSI
jgi:hypothetical protein